MTRDFTSLRADIRRELSSIDRLAAQTEQLLARIPDRPSFVEVRAAGSLLHDFYTGAEKIFQRIALEMEGGLPAGAEWHSELLARMATPVEDRRPAVISEELKDQFGEALRFRHLFRYMYGFQLRWDRCHALLSDLPGIRREFERQLHIFLDLLRSLEKS